jgi:hypothetical protein
VTGFKPFKIAFRKERNTTMVKRNYKKMNKITLAGWVDKTLYLSFTRKNTMSWFKGVQRCSKVFKFDHLTLGPCI